VFHASGPGSGSALTRSRELLRRILREHAPDEVRRQLAERVVEHLERSNFEIDEASKALWQRPFGMPHGEAPHPDTPGTVAPCALPADWSWSVPPAGQPA
jgi:hypothetical protein